MFLRELDTPVTHIKGVGAAFASRLAALGLVNIAGLLSWYPRDWEDRSHTVPLKDFAGGEAVCTEVEVLAHDWFGFGRMKTLKVHVEDTSAKAVLVCFNRPFLEKQLEQGKRYRLWGRFFFKYGEIQSTAFEVEPAQDQGSASFGQILPVYPLSAGLAQGSLRRLVKTALAEYGTRLEDELPASILAKYDFPSKAKALASIHFPANHTDLANARRALIYEELFYLEILVGKRAMERREKGRRPGTAAHSIQPKIDTTAEAWSPLQARLVERLPFALTAGQLTVIDELNRDMESGYPMARLLQGDVGSGKTLVAFLACLRAVENGGQAAVLAPTELLARQHAENAARILEPLGVRLAFLTGNVKTAGRNTLLKALAKGDIDIVLGTHALFSKDVSYKDLRLVVVDEQHRFGVVQRAAIMAKGNYPDLLMMSATPIPRTLALTVFGDLDVSVIKDMPPGRKPVKTHLARQGNEARVYEFVRKELQADRQAYFVYPIIESGENNGLKDAETWAGLLKKQVYPQFKVELVHSRLDEEIKRDLMERFRAGTVQVLVATSVVEVGVDVPNASCMVVEHAERFGLSALHQLRGRVGRGIDQSYCFLVYTKEPTEDGKTRLRVMLENSDGFVIAEEDLKLRGPGQIAGLEQSGYLSLGLADPVRDAEELAKARIDAFAMLEADPKLSRPENTVVAAVLERAPPFSTVIQ